MKLKIKFNLLGYADCDIEIRAKGFILASIYWADANGILPGWSSFAMFPVDPSGSGNYHFVGHRAIPDCVTHICAKCVSQDFFTVEETLTEIPAEFLPAKKQSDMLASFTLMSDLHLSGKPGKIARALRMVESATLIVGDLTNDGFSEQFESFRCCIESEIPERLVLAVTGNHDQLAGVASESDYVVCSGYDEFQEYLFDKTRTLGFKVDKDMSGAYSVQYGEIDIIGLQCVTSGRKFGFSDGTQLRWLEKHLNEEDDTQWYIVMCHAPLLAHNPHRKDGTVYFSGDHNLQKIMDRHRNIIFISGHTHFSPNTRQGNVEYCEDTQTIYIDDGSVVSTDLQGESLMPAEWKDGVVGELKLYNDYAEIIFKSVHSGMKYPRGYYRFDKILYGEEAE